MSEVDKSWVEMLNALPNIHTSDTADTGSYSYRYASLPSILEKIKPVMAEHGWAVTQDIGSSDNGATVATRFFHTSGEGRSFGPLTIKPQTNTPQAVGSVITYARRYALVAALGLAPDEDDDAAAAQKPAAQKPADRGPDVRAETNRAWHTVKDLFPDDPETIWWQLRDQMRIARDHNLTVREADDLIQQAMVIAEGETNGR